MQPSTKLRQHYLCILILKPKISVQQQLHPCHLVHPPDAVTFTTNNTGGTTTYTWTNDTPSIGLAASGEDFLPSFTAVNTDTQPITATITVTPLFTDDIDCDGIQQTFTITVNPTAQVNEYINEMREAAAELSFDELLRGAISRFTF